MKNYKLIKIFTTEECDELVSKLQTASNWNDGKETAGKFIKFKKTNFELGYNEELNKEINDKLNFGITNNNDIQDNFLFKTIINYIVNNYKIGGKYDGHFDNEFMPSIFNGEPLRTDYSFTLFLNDNFEGGKLKIENQIVKPKKGYGVFYKSNLYHSVTEVLSNERFAIVGWIQSLIKDNEARDALVHLRYVHKKILEDFDEKIYKEFSAASQILWRKFL